MEKLSRTQLKEVLGWASRQKDKKGRSLLERARESLLTGSHLKYNTEVDIAKGIMEWDCNCPYVKKTGKPCRHVIAQLILLHEKELSQNPKWAGWFKEYHSHKLEEVLDAFSQF
jgi:hypothetical protein